MVQLLNYTTASEQDEESALNRAMWREEMAYRRLHPSLLDTYLGQYVAIYDEQLIDHDMDELELYLRVRKQFGDEFVLMTQVEDEAEAVYTFRSPKLASVNDNELVKVAA
ncbi:MAG: DUF5678 domain-containing protein [Chloroflexota bacterium]